MDKVGFVVDFAFAVAADDSCTIYQLLPSSKKFMGSIKMLNLCQISLTCLV